MANYVLFQWGPIQFQVYPLNINQMSHATAADWAKKEIAGAAIYREWVGENEETITLKGKVFPHFFARASHQRGIKESGLGFGSGRDPVSGLLTEHRGGYPSAGGLYHLDIIDNMRRLGQAQILMRGDGWHYGWYVIESLSRGHSLIALDGVGQMIEFEAMFQRVPIPNDGAEGITQMFRSDAVGSGSGEAAPQPPQETVPIA